MIRLTWRACRAWTARATARYDLPVPAGPMPKVTMFSAMASAYSFCPPVFGRTARPRDERSSSAVRTSRGPDVVVHHVDGAVDLDRVEALTRLEQDDQLLEQGAHPFGTVTLDGDLVAPDRDADIVERALDQPQQLVTLAQQAGHEVVAGNEEFDLGACHVSSVGDPSSAAGKGDPMAAVAAGDGSPGRAALNPEATRRLAPRGRGGGGGPPS